MRFIIYSLLLTFLFQSAYSQEINYESKLKSSNVVLFNQTKPKGNYVRAVRSGNLIFLAGHGSTRADGSVFSGKVGKELSKDQGIEAARLSTISLLSTLKGEIGDFNRVKRIVKVTGWINCTPEFNEQSLVMNGCSDLLIAIFGDIGYHARTSVGTNALPNNFAAEIEMIVEVE